ncbi:hypothetical protein MTR62_08475, partial [Novosphingobium sp. 1949]
SLAKAVRAVRRAGRAEAQVSGVGGVGVSFGGDEGGCEEGMGRGLRLAGVASPVPSIPRGGACRKIVFGSLVLGI